MQFVAPAKADFFFFGSDDYRKDPKARVTPRLRSNNSDFQLLLSRLKHKSLAAKKDPASCLVLREITHQLTYIRFLFKQRP